MGSETEADRLRAAEDECHSLSETLLAVEYTLYELLRVLGPYAPLGERVRRELEDLERLLKAKRVGLGGVAADRDAATGGSGVMSERQWTDHEFSPWIDVGPQHILAPAPIWDRPMEWNRLAEAEGRRRRVCCGLRGDVFSEAAKLYPHRARFLGLIAQTPHLDWQLVTEWPACVLPTVTVAILYAQTCVYDSADVSKDIWESAIELATQWGIRQKPPPNVWLMVRATNQPEADRRIPELLRVPAAVRGVIASPLVGPLDLSRWIRPVVRHPSRMIAAALESGASKEGGSRLGWVVVGGEGGLNADYARPCYLEWVRDLVEQCQHAETACFVTRLGANVWHEVDGMGDQLRFQDTSGAAMAEWPEDVRVREFPA